MCIFRVRVYAFVISVLAIMGLPTVVMADCGPVPIGHEDDMAISFLRANGTQIAPASKLNSAVKRGVVVYDTADDSLKLCDGSDWVTVGTGGGSGGVTSLAALTDVDVVGVTNGQALVYDGVLSQWVAKDIAAGGASVMFSARGNADKTGNKLSNFQAVDSNIGSAYDNSTGVFTAPKAGVYYFRASVLSQGTGTAQLSLNKKGVMFAKAYGHNNFQQISVAAPVWLEVGDTVTTDLSLGSGAQLHTNFWDSFSGVIIDGGGGTGGAGGSSTLAGLNDVDVAGATNGQALVFNSASNKWEAQSFVGAGFTLGSPIKVNMPGNISVSGACKFAATPSMVVPKAGYYYVEAALRGYIYSGVVVHVTMDLLNSANVPVIRAVSGSARDGAHYVTIDNSKIVYLDAGTYTMEVVGDNGSGNCAGFSWDRMISASFTAREILGGGGSGGGGGESGGASTLAGLTDVDVAGATAGQALVYNAVAGKWEPETINGGDAYSFYVISNAHLTVPAGGGRVVLKNVIINTDNVYNPATGLMTAPVKGVYQVNWGGIGYDSVGVYRYYLQKNGVNLVDQVRIYNMNVGEFQSGARTAYVALNAGDTLAIHYVSDQGVMTAYGNGGYVYFGGHLVSGSGGGSGGAGGDVPAAGAVGQVQFNDGSNKFAANADLRWDNVQKRLGVGKAVPAYTLDVARAVSSNVNGDGAENSYRIARIGASSASDRGLEVGAPTDGIVSPVYLKVFGTSADFAIYNEDNVRQLTIKKGGNVGIGTDTPQSKLHVVGDGADIALSASDTNLVALLSSRSRDASRGALYFNHDSAPVYNDVYLGSAFELVDGVSVAAPIFRHAGSHSMNASIMSIGHLGIKFMRAGAGNIGTNFTPTTSMFIAPSGNVGIGNEDPKGRLSLPVFATTGGPAGNYNNFQIMLYPSGTANASYGMGMESSNIWMNTAGGFKFYVNGGHVSTIAANGVYSVVSDNRLKDDVKPLEGALEKIATLRGVSFVWKDRETKGTDLQVGLIAQDVQAVYPELVVTDLNGTLSVNYAGLVAPLIEAVKTLRDENAALKTEIQSLRDDVEMLKAIVMGGTKEP